MIYDFLNVNPAKKIAGMKKQNYTRLTEEAVIFITLIKLAGTFVGITM